MGLDLPLSLLSSLQGQAVCRQAQLQQLAVLYNNHFPSPRILVCSGLDDTGKIESILTILQSREIDHVFVKSNECLSQKHLLSKIFASCLRRAGEDAATEQYDRVDSFTVLLDNLRKLFGRREQRLVLIVDGIDEQKGASTTLLPALARIGEVIPCISVIVTSSSPKPLMLRKAGAFQVHFPPYSRTDAIRILLKSPPRLLPDPAPSYMPKIDNERLSHIYKQFITTVHDSLTSYTSTSIKTFRRTCERLWPRFIWPLVSGEKLPGLKGAGAWDFPKLLSKNRILFQAEGERALQEHLRADKTVPITFQDLMRLKEEHSIHTPPTPLPNESKRATAQSSAPSENAQSKSRRQPPLLKHFTTLVLLAAYLASHNLQKHDIVLFSRLSSSSTSKRKYLTKSRSGGITKTPTKSPGSKAKSKHAAADDRDEEGDLDTVATPSKKAKAKEITAAEASTPKKERADRSMRAIFDRTSNIARPFTLERLIAILRAIHPDGLPQRRGTADRVYMELAELERLKLVVKAEGGRGEDGGGGFGEDGMMEEKWRVNVGREWVKGMGQAWSVGLDGWEID